MPTDFGVVHISEMDIPYRLLLAAFCFFVTIWARRVAVSGIETWQDTRTPVSPSLDESPSPWAAISNGVEGCATFFVMGAVMILFAIFTVNLLVPDTDLTTYAFSVIRSLFAVLFDLLKSIAKALLA